VQYRVARLGITGQAGLAALTAAAVLVVSVLVPSQHALQTLSADLARAHHTSAVSTAEQAAPRLLNTLPTRAEMPRVIGQVFAEAKAVGVPLDTGRYLYAPAKGGEIARYELEFPVKASYPDIRSFIDHTLAAVPAAALGKLRIERKAVGDAVVNADIEFVVFLRSGEAP
jgi:Tfp pilus assembly protein PilO